MTAADLALECLAASEARALRRAAELEADRQVYRELLSIALSQLHSLRRQLDRAQSRIQ